MIHEIGHILVAFLFKVKVKEIYLYPLGAISKLDMDLNISPYKEFLILAAGPFFQWIAYGILIALIPEERELINFYNFHIFYFNLLPISPLDGGKGIYFSSILKY